MTSNQGGPGVAGGECPAPDPVVTPPYPKPDDRRRPTKQERLSDADWFVNTLSWRLAAGDYPGVAALYDRTSAHVARAGEGTLIHEIHQLIFMLELERAWELLAWADRANPEAPILTSTALAIATAQDDGALAESLAERVSEHLEGHLDAGEEHELRASVFGYLCRSRQFDRAEEFLDRWFGDGQPSGDVVAYATAIYASTGQWDRILTTFEHIDDQGEVLNSEFLYEAVGKAARRTGEYERVVQALDRSLELSPPRSISDFRDRLLTDMYFASSLRTGTVSDLTATDDYACNPTFQKRRRHLAEVLTSPRLGGAEPGTIIFSTDSNYVLGTAVAVCSLLRNNLGIGTRYPIQVLCADDAAPAAQEVFDRIGSAFVAPITLRLASSFYDDTIALKTALGVFSGGQGLSRACYFRIFALSSMLEAGVRGRALYLDSDTCVGPGVSALMNLDLGGQPLAARMEAPVDAVVAAALKLNLEPSAYFNSGVLLVDLEHPDLPGALNRAIHMCLHAQDRLTFYDQCALNVAFAGRWARLPDRFNHYVRPDHGQPSDVLDTVIWHFVSSRKPWDPMYPSGHAMRWLYDLKVLSQVLPKATVEALLAVQFDRTQS